MADPFVAEIRIFPFNFAPKGWAWCDGQLMPLSQNTALFSLLGTTYGGNGKSNFALPDLQGRAPMHPGQGPGLSLHDLGETCLLYTSSVLFNGLFGTGSIINSTVSGGIEDNIRIENTTATPLTSLTGSGQRQHRRGGHGQRAAGEGCLLYTSRCV